MSNCADPRKSVTGPLAKQWGTWLVLSASSILFFAVLAVEFGGDGNWDLKNYHYYNPYSVFAGRLALDRHPAAIQSYLNPSLDLLLTYPLLRYGNVFTLSAVLGGLQGLNFVLLIALALRLLPAGQPRGALAGIAAAISMSGALVVSELGTTFGDLTTAVLVLGAVLACVVSMQSEGATGAPKYLLLGGFLIGLAMGFKLTNGIYLVGLLVSCAGQRQFRRLDRLVPLLAAAACGLLLVDGWWSWELWTLFGNPVFPFLNGIFKADSYPSANFVDARFFPTGILETIIYPFVFSWKHNTAEQPFRDFRFPVAYLVAVTYFVYRLTSSPCPGREKVGGRKLLAAFILVSFILWQSLFSIQRYAIVIELLLPLFILLTLTYTLPRHGGALFMVVGIFLSFTTVSPNWGRIDPAATPQPIVAPETQTMLAPLLNGAVVVLGPPPLAYLAPSLDLDVAAWLARPFNDNDAVAARRTVATASRIVAIFQGSGEARAATNQVLTTLGLPLIDPSACRNFSTLFDADLFACPLAAR